MQDEQRALVDGALDERGRVTPEEPQDGAEERQLIVHARFAVGAREVELVAALGRRHVVHAVVQVEADDGSVFVGLGDQRHLRQDVGVSHALAAFATTRRHEREAEQRGPQGE
jgi:hypothetical protein